MKNFIYALSFCAVICLMGCVSENVPGSTSRLLRYSVDFNNVGLKEVGKTSITLCKGKESSFASGGWLLPGFEGSHCSFNLVPDPENTLEWIDMESKELTRVKVKIQLPKLFYNAEYPSSIVFYINSSTNQVQVAYDVFSPEKKDFILVDSEGKPFERYEVEFRNIGLTKIKVRDVMLCDSQESSKVLCGVLLPGKVKNYGCFDKIPDPEITLTWVDLESDAISKAKLKIQVPERFYRGKYLPKIIFYINSSTDQVQIAYSVYSAWNLVDSEGKPFELKIGNLISPQPHKTEK